MKYAWISEHSDSFPVRLMCEVLDLFSRKVVGWSIGASLATELVSDALRKAIVERHPDGKELLHHSDRGCQYTSNAYQKILRTLGYLSPNQYEAEHAPAVAA